MPEKKDGQAVIGTAAVPVPPPEDKDAAWIKEVAALPAEKQVEAVAAKLKERNPGFDGTVKHRVSGGVVTRLEFLTDNVTDLSPVRALTGLTALYCGSSTGSKEKLADLSPLKDLKLTYLDCRFTSVSDLTPLKDMKLTTLICYGTPVTDLSPLKDMKLTTLLCNGTKVSDLTPLKGMPLQSISCNLKSERDTAILRSIKTLEGINGQPAAEFWKKMDAQLAAFDAWLKQVAALPPEKQVEAVAAKLKECNPGFDGKEAHRISGGKVYYLTLLTDNVADISAVRALTGLNILTCNGSGQRKGKLADLSPLKEMKLEQLHINSTQVSDLSPLKGMQLTNLGISGTPVSDLTPLKDMGLKRLTCPGTNVSNLSPLKGMELEFLNCAGAKVSDLSPLKGMPLKDLHCDFKPERDAAILRSIKTLETINGQAAAEFWKAVDAKQP
jgi:Leucine-rich repeat (LRR) protein